jgi:hypothetical protein
LKDHKGKRAILCGLAVTVACLGIGGTAAATPTSDGAHLPDFSLMNKRLPLKKLPLGMGFSFGGARGFGHGHRPIHGPVWFGEVKRPGVTIAAAGVKRWVCMNETRSGNGSGSGVCSTLAAARELGMLSISTPCDKHQTQTRIDGLVPNGVTGLEIELESGTVARIVPVIDNTVAFPIDRENVTLRGVGGAAAERLELRLPLGGSGAFRGSSCIVGYASTAKATPSRE